MNSADSYREYTGSEDEEDEQLRLDLYHQHDPLSPQSGAESLFLAGLQTSTVSANVLAEELKRQHRPNSTRSSVYSVVTDDFATAVESPDELDSINDKEQEISLETIESTDFDFYPESSSKAMSAAVNSSVPTTTEPAAKPAPVVEAPATEGDKIDVASHVYEGVKGAWGWGKGVVVFSPFMGLAEGIANKVVGVVGTDLEEIDGNLKPQIANIDSGILNPAIDAVVGIVLGAVGKTEDIIKPIIFSVLTPFGLIEEEKKAEATS